MKPFLVVGAAFPLESTCMKCFDTGIVPQKRSLNYSLIRTRRVVEQAFGRLKGRWKVMDGQCRLNDPVFVWKVAMVCCIIVHTLVVKQVMHIAYTRNGCNIHHV